MKRLLSLLAFATTCTLLLSCSKSGKEGSSDGGSFGNNPKTTVPDELVGYWLTGSTSIGNFWGYDGSYQGAAYELATGYMLYKDGKAKQYFYYTNTSYYCRTQVLGYKEGTVEVDMNKKTFTFYPASGNYRYYYSCGSSGDANNGKTQTYGSDELYPTVKVDFKDIEFKREDGKLKSWHVYFSDGSAHNFTKSQEPQK
jgi:hypothetical protein